MLGTRQTTVPRAALRRLIYSFNHPGCSTTGVTLVPHYSRFKYPIKSPLASNANACFSARIIDRESLSRSIRFYSTSSFSNSSSPRDVGSPSCSNSSVENNEADADEATDEAYEAMRNAAMDDAYRAIELALDSVVKIFSVASSPSYFLPWQNKIQRESMGSGFVISGRRILTNAHVVADHTFVLVRKHGSPIKYKAEVQAVGHECDLAILVVENEEFWEGMNFLELGDIPFIQEAVAVVGYPQGGDNISVTKGVVSRVELTQYAHSATQLLAIQIDAAINPGNSGGPAIMGDKTTLFWLHLHVTTFLRNNDIAMDLYEPGNGSNGINTLSLQPLVPVHQFDKLPSYFIFAGLVFIPLTHPYLHEYGEEWYNTSPRRLCERAFREVAQKAGQQLVILSQVLMDDINTGYERLTELQVKKVNGTEVDNLKHLRQLVEENHIGNVRFDLDDGKVIVLDYDSAKVATSRILKRHRILSAMSSDLDDEQNAQDVELACSN
ncbi:Protease Do-like 10- mitochondrial [Striga hermonthica]|uniref:Protease Do-like 10- mitochondrial n=1 Tax=Striga hermonthica TaxID=68872 RepID=A0A9N7MT55_STRHE|nr:Protease Do-like 10- mitochondrial [Striga hermonthica]